MPFYSGSAQIRRTVFVRTSDFHVHVARWRIWEAPQDIYKKTSTVFIERDVFEFQNWQYGLRNYRAQPLAWATKSILFALPMSSKLSTVTLAPQAYWKEVAFYFIFLLVGTQCATHPSILSTCSLCKSLKMHFLKGTIWRWSSFHRKVRLPRSKAFRFVCIICLRVTTLDTPPTRINYPNPSGWTKN